MTDLTAALVEVEDTVLSFLVASGGAWSSAIIAGPPAPVPPVLMLTCEYVDNKMYGYAIVEAPSAPGPPTYTEL